MDLEEFGTQTVKEKSRKDEPRPEGKEIRTCGEDCREEQNKLRRSEWSLISSDTYIAGSLTIKKLYPGVYAVKNSNIGVLFCRVITRSDDLIRFPDSTFDRIEKEVDNFWEIGDNFKKYGFLHRRGYLFYGPAGSGKTCLVQRIVQDVVQREGIVFLCSGHPGMSSTGLSIFREVEPDTKIVCIFEDIDSIIQEYGESDVLMLLDGENQVDKVINIATTNYPEKLDKRIVARPRRFDRVMKIDMPNEDIRKHYFKVKLGLNGDDIDKWVKASNGFSFASLSELVISVKCLGNSFEESVERLSSLNIKKYSSSEFEGKTLGFGS
jgi:SpoVK/Ycf46/Vps4 family AAA+-type ATPase